jgi:hypothetical protein
LRDALRDRGIGKIGGNRGGCDAARLQMRDGFVEIRLLARDEYDVGAVVAERFGDLQAEATRASGDVRPVRSNRFFMASCR